MLQNSKQPLLLSIMAEMGSCWRDGWGQYDRQRMMTAIDKKSLMTKTIENELSQSSKHGLQSNHKVGYPRELRELIAYGDITNGDAYDAVPLPRHVFATDRKIEATDEISNRGGEPIAGMQLPDMAAVEEEMRLHNALVVAGDNLGYTEGRGLYQAGFNRQKWEDGPQRPLDRIEKLDTSDIMNEDDQVRADVLSNSVRTYDPSKTWIGTGHAPGSSKMRSIPFNI